jgi:Eco57I restriction endonuclease.
MKFDFVIGNPPYMEQTESESTRMPPVYNYFMDEAYKIADVVELITPARFLFNAGYTPTTWNEKMLNDEHLKVEYYEPDSSRIFPNTDIKGGVVISYRNRKEYFGKIGIFTKYPELNSILHKVDLISIGYLDKIIFSPLSYQLSELMKQENPTLVNRLRTSAFVNLADIFYESNPCDGKEYMVMHGLLNHKRVIRYVRTDYIKDSANILNRYSVLLPKANGAGYFGETLSAPIIAKPNEGYTQTYIAIGAFDKEEDALSVEKYIKTKFARAMLGILKITQDCPKPKWKRVPMQDFSSSSDIDWLTSISNIDKQLYKKYNLSDEEINFIETKVKEME